MQHIFRDNAFYPLYAFLNSVILLVHFPLKGLIPNFLQLFVWIFQYSVLLLSEKEAITIQYQPPSIVLKYNMASTVQP